jgi:8-oxo-dGTP pyrophosphatase MutT (NUDIX family)
MAEPSEETVLRRARELWEEAGYTDGAEAKSVSGLGGPLPRARVLLTPTRRQEFIQQARNEICQVGFGDPELKAR